MTTLEKLKKYLKEIAKNDKHGKKINAILELKSEKDLITKAKEIDAKIKNNKAGKLAGMIILVKANINVLGLHASCGSKVLEDYESTYNASVIDEIEKEDGLILGMANMDEFAQGSSGETSAFGPTRNPINTDLITGGTSSGCAAAVKANFCDIALGSDTGGSCRNPASHCGVIGIKPSYASVSRHGLIDSAMSFDQIGILAKNIRDAGLLLSTIYKKDNQDSISQETKKINIDNINKIPKNIKIGLLDFEINNKSIQEIINNKVKELSEKYKWEVIKIKIPNLDLAVATYYPIQYVEFFSTTRRLDGRRYGKKIEEFCGPEVLRRILGGSEITKAEHKGRHYHLALKVRKLLQNEFEKIFKKVDCIISPTVPRLPHKIGEKISVQDMYGYDALTIPANLVGNCAVSIPVGDINGIPVGMQIACDRFNDELMLRIGSGIEKA